MTEGVIEAVPVLKAESVKRALELAKYCLGARILWISGVLEVTGPRTVNKIGACTLDSEELGGSVNRKVWVSLTKRSSK